MPYKSYTLTEATRKMEQYCTYQERCHKEVRDKLIAIRMIPEAIDHIIGYLIQNNYLNEQRFAQSFAGGKFRIKKWGRNRIIEELKQREISNYAIKSALSRIEEVEYLKMFHDLATKRWLQMTDQNIQKKKRKLADYLLYRGWESNLVYSKIKELAKDIS